MRSIFRVGKQLFGKDAEVVSLLNRKPKKYKSVYEYWRQLGWKRRRAYLEARGKRLIR